MNCNKEKVKQSEKILQTAFECISSKGYVNVSMRDIADEAGVALSQLNYYYKNKEGLLIEVIKMMMQKYLLDVEEQLKKGRSTKEKVASFVTFFKNMLSDNPQLFRLLFDFCGMALWSDSFGALLRDLFNELANMVEKYLLDDFSSTEIFAGHSKRAIARMMFGSMFGIAIQIILDPEEKELLDALNTVELVFE